MPGHSDKYFLAYYLADQLEVGRKYGRAEVEQLIASRVDPSTYADPTMALDHIRMAMVDNKFVLRDTSGSTYWVSERFVKPLDPVKLNFERLTCHSPSSAGDDSHVCEHCGQQFDGVGLVRHFIRQHTYSLHIDDIKRFLIQR